MFDSLKAFLRLLALGFWEGLKGLALSYWGALIAMGTALLSCWDLLNGWVADAAQVLVELVIPSIGVQWSSSLLAAAALGNKFVPLTEACVFFVAWGALSLGLQIYALIKSWIPTVSGSGG